MNLPRILVAIAIQFMAALPVEAASYAYASSGSIVHIIDVVNPSIVARIPLGVDFFGGTPALEPSGTHLYVPMFHEGAVAIMDTASRTVIGKIPISRVSGVLMHPGSHVAYASGSAIVDGVEGGFLAVIDTDMNTVVTTIPMEPGSLVHSMILNPTGTKLYVSNHASGKVVVIDASTHTVATTIPVVGPLALAVHPAGTFVYIASANRVSVLDSATDTVVATIPTGARSMVVHPNGTFLYVIAGDVAVVDTQTSQVVATISLPNSLEFAALTPSGTRLYVAGSVISPCFRPPCDFIGAPAPTIVIDTTTNTVMTTIPPGPFFFGGRSVTVDPSGHRIYANAGGLTVIDASTNAIIATLPPAHVVFGATRPAPPDAQVFHAIGSRDGALRGTQWGAPGDRPVLADYDGDGRADFAIFRPREAGQEAVWWIQRSSDGGIVRQQWGTVSFGDVPVPADYDGDGKADLAVWRASDLSAAPVWFIVRSSDGGGVAQRWGVGGDLPVPADYDGDGRTDIAVWRPDIGTWFVVGTRDGSVISRQFGVATDVPVPVDYDGDRRADFAVWRPGTGEWFVIGSQSGAITSITLGAPGDVPVPRDYDGDGKADFAVWRPSTGEWLILRSSDGRLVTKPWGMRGDLPLPADIDGDRAADLMVYRP